MYLPSNAKPLLILVHQTQDLGNALPPTVSISSPHLFHEFDLAIKSTLSILAQSAGQGDCDGDNPANPVTTRSKSHEIEIGHIIAQEWL